MRHTRMRQIAKANKDPMWMWKDQVGTDTIELMTRVHSLGLNPKLDRSFMWLRIQYEDDKKVRNYWGIAGTYARRIK